MTTLRSIAKGLMLALILASSPAYASVVYNWLTVENSEFLFPEGGQLEITDAAWRAGGLSADLSNFYTPSDDPFSTFPSSPLTSLTFTANNKTVAIFPTTGESNIQFPWYLEADLGVDYAGFLTGGLLASNGESDFTMNSSGGGSLWTILRFGSDDVDSVGEECFSAPGCSGATGRWLVDPATIPLSVPAPPVGLLFIICAGFMLFYRMRLSAVRRRLAAPQQVRTPC